MKRLIFLASFAIVHASFSQNEEIDIEQFAERLFQLQDEDLSYEDLYESLLLYYTNKLNLNKATPRELASLYILSPIQLNHFFDYRKQYGDLLSIHELQAIDAFDVETIRRLKPFVTVNESHLDPRPFFQRLWNEENNYLLLRYTRRLEEQLGYTPALPLDTAFIRNEDDVVTDTAITAPTRYRGSPDKIYGRFRVSHRGDFSLGFTFEKDAGERLAFDHRQNGFDFYSYHLLLENKLGFKRIMLGDYQLRIGQGMVFGSGINIGKGAETVNATKRNSIGLRPYTSVLESGFFRGIGLTKQVEFLEVTGFYSSLRQDGNIQSDTTTSDFAEYIHSIQNTGLHRTESERSFKDQIVEESYGMILEYNPNRWFSFGLSGLNTTYSKPLQRRPNNYNQFEFEGDHNWVASAFFHYTWQNFTFFGETATSKSEGIGALGGFVSSLSPIVDMSLVLRNYDREFHSFYSDALSENSRNINEHGVYWGMAIKPNRRHKLNFYYDQFTFPWLRYRTEAPSSGNEWLIRYTYTPARRIALYAQVRQQLRQVTLPEGNLNVLKDQVRHNYLFNVNYEATPSLQLRTRVQSSVQNEGDHFSRGFAIVQDFNLEVAPFKFNTRIALFDTDDFDNAQYVYENDVLYAFSLPAYNGQGIRSYLMMRYDPFKNISMWIRYAQSSFRHVDTVGSGLNEAPGNLTSELKCMLRIKL